MSSDAIERPAQAPSLRGLIWISFLGFGVVLIATALLTPAITARFYPLLPDQGAAWYFWKLPSASTLTRITYWTGYALHQLAVWVLLIRARAHRGNLVDSLRANRSVLVVNLLFVGLHLVQTYFWYDGLAQDAPIWTSQGSVIVMLILVLFLEIPRRGLFWGKPMAVPGRTYGFVRRWHGMYISWAVVFTFWFHPMEGNWGLLSGFVYMFLLFTQISLFNTKAHMNAAWIVILEFGVVVHGTLITVYKDNPVWPMFMVGFLVMFVVTQMHALRWARRFRYLILGVFVTSVALLYIFVRGVDHLYEVTFIPVALYGGAIALLLIGHLVERLTKTE